MDEPESLAGISLAAREQLDNLILVVNCNRQRLDGPARGNGNIIQELETLFAGAGWNVIKVFWGSNWDVLFARDKEGRILRRMAEAVDGEFQKLGASDGLYNREHFFSRYPELAALVGNMSDKDIDALKRGGHDPVKIYAAYNAAVSHRGQPTVILAQTWKGYRMGRSGQGIRRGIYLSRRSSMAKDKPGVQLMGSGSILPEVIAAAELLEADFGVAADVCSVTSFGELRKDGIACDRERLLNPDQSPPVPMSPSSLPPAKVR